MRFSVVTVCKNAVRTVRRAVDSALAQTYPHVELIVVDGASEDGTQASLEAVRHRLAHFRSEPDGGIYPAMNKGARLATGDYVYFLNADDRFADDRVLADVAAFLRRSPCDFLYGDINVVRPGGAVQRHNAPPVARALDEMVDGCLPHQGSFTHRSLFDRVGPFDESYRICGDYQWMLRVLQRPDIRVGHFPRVIADYAADGVSASNPKAYREMCRAQNEAAVFQSADWLRRRLHKYQEAVGHYRTTLLLDKERQAMAARLAEAEAFIQAVKRNPLYFSIRASRWAGRWAKQALRRLRAG